MPRDLNQYKLSEEENQSIYEQEIVPELFADAKSKVFYYATNYKKLIKVMGVSHCRKPIKLLIMECLLLLNTLSAKN